MYVHYIFFYNDKKTKYYTVISQTNLPFYSMLIIVALIECLFAKDDKGLKYYHEGDFKKAIQFYESILKKNIDSNEAHFGMGSSLFKDKDSISAEKAFTQTLSSEDNMLQSKAHFNLGNLYNHKQELEKSLTHYKKSIELNPKDLDAKWNYELTKKMINQQKNQSENEGKDSEEKEKNNKEENPSKEGENNSQEKNSSDKKTNEKNEQNKSDEEQKKSDNSKDKKTNPEQNSPEDTNKSQDDKKDPEKQNSPNPEVSEQQKEMADSSRNKMNAQAILNALKNKEKINKRRQMTRMKTRKLEKDW